MVDIWLKAIAVRNNELQLESPSLISVAIAQVVISGFQSLHVKLKYICTTSQMGGFERAKMVQFYWTYWID